MAFEAYPLKKADLRSLDFVIDRLCMKLFRTNNMDTVRQWQQFFNFDLPSVNRAANFLWVKIYCKLLLR